MATIDSTAQHSTAQHSTAQHSTAQHSPQFLAIYRLRNEDAFGWFLSALVLRNSPRATAQHNIEAESKRSLFSVATRFISNNWAKEVSKCVGTQTQFDNYLKHSTAWYKALLVLSIALKTQAKINLFFPP